MGLKYGVIGTGALGGFYGGKLAQAGKDVHFLFRSDYNYVCENGLRVDSVKGDFHLKNIFCYSSVTEMPLCDVVLVCLKTTSNDLLPDLLAPIVHSESLVVLIQNGLGVEEKLAEKMPDLNIAGGLAFICSQKVGPGHIQHLDLGKLVIGSYSVQSNKLPEQVCNDFVGAGVQASLSDDLGYSRWQKLVWNIPFNGLTVVLDATTDQLMANDATRELAFEMMLEVVRAANQCGYLLKEEFAQKMMETTLEMKPYAPSMKLDFDFKRPMEIETIYSRPVQEAANVGFEMKKVAMLEKQLRFIQSRQ